MTMKEDVLALADKVEATIGGCGECVARRDDGRCLSVDTFECVDAVCAEVAKRLREIVERDAEDVTTVSAYDLLPDVDREALASVREMGGVDKVREKTRDLCDALNRIADRLGVAIESRRELWPFVDVALDAIDSRLMPEGCGWPRFEDGGLVRFGDEVAKHGEDYEIGCICLCHDGSFSLNFRAFSKGELVKRPAVLAADGEPLEVGQTVWAENGDELVIGAIEDGGHTVACRYADVGDGIPTHGMWSPSDLTHKRPVLDADGVPLEVGQTVWEVDTEVADPMTVVDVAHDLTRCEYTCSGGKVYRPCLPPERLTHQRPVLDADGVPIKVGDTVWDVETGIEFEVSRVEGCSVTMSNGGYYSSAFPRYCPSKLAHAKPEPPDSWERIEEDKGLNPFDYCKKVGHKLFTFDNAEEYKSSDLVRRCRALAERGEL